MAIGAKKLDQVIVERAVENALDEFKPFRLKIKEEKGFSASKRANGVASGSSVKMRIENPVGSGKTLYIVVVECVSSGLADIDVYDGGTLTGSAAVTPKNLKKGSKRTSVANVQWGGTEDLTNAELAHETVNPGGTLVRAIGAMSEVGELVEMPEGTSILVIMTNQAGTGANMSIRGLWWEE